MPDKIKRVCCAGFGKEQCYAALIRASRLDSFEGLRESLTVSVWLYNFVSHTRTGRGRP